MNLPEIKGFSSDQIQQAVETITKKELIKSLPKASTTNPPILYVFRHGQSEDNEKYLFSGWRNPALTNLGIDQAKILAQKMSLEKLDLAISSTLIRSTQTLEIVLKANETWKSTEDPSLAPILCKSDQNDLNTAYPPKPLGIETYFSTGKILMDDRIIERSYGNLQGTSKVELYLKDPETEEKYRRSYDFPAQNGESLKMVEQRVRLFLDELLPFMKKNRLNVALSCHSNSMRAIRRLMEKLSVEEMCKLENPLAQDFASYNISSL